MRRIFPLKPVSEGHGQQQPRGAGSASSPCPQRENSRVKGTPVASRYAPELSKKAPANRSRKTDASSSEEGSLPTGRANGPNNQPEHWCSACPPARENGARCGTPNGDDIDESKEVEKGIISCPSEDPLKAARSQHPIADSDSANREREKPDLASGFCNPVAEVAEGHERASSVIRLPSKRSGLGALGNVTHDRNNNSKTPVKPKPPANATAPTTTQEQTARSTSDPKSRLILQTRSASRPGSPRVQSTRILKVPGSVHEPTSLSSIDSARSSDASSSTGSATPRSSRTGSREMERLTLPLSGKSVNLCRSQSHSEDLGRTKLPPRSPSTGRKPIESPRSTRKELLPSGIPSAPDFALSVKAQSSKYSGARVVADRLAKAFRGSSREKDGKAISLDGGERSRTKLGQTRKVSVQAEEIEDASYDGSCSDTSSFQTGDRDDCVSLTNVLHLVRPGNNNVPSQQLSRKDSSGSTVTTGDSALSSQELDNDGRLPQGLSNDHPTPENGPDSGQISKNSGPITGSRRWGTAAANEGNRSPSRRLHPTPENGSDSSQISKNSGPITGSRRWGTAAANEVNRSTSRRLHLTPENGPDASHILKNSGPITGSRRWGTAAANEGNRSPSRRLHLTPENGPDPSQLPLTSENGPDSSQISKNSVPITGSKRWGSAAANEGNGNPSHKLHLTPENGTESSLLSKSSGPITGSGRWGTSAANEGNRSPSPKLHPTPENGPDLSPDSSQISKNPGPITGGRRWGTTPENGCDRSPSDKLHYSPALQEKEASRQEKEREILKGWLEGLKRQSDGMTDDLDMKARMAEQRISMLSGELSFESQDLLRELSALDEDGNISAGINIMQQRIKRMHEEKKRLALEVASEVKRRITERAAAKEVLVMMKREMEACVRVMEKENLGIQAGFERELEKRENDWQKILETITLEEKWSRERVRKLEEEKGGLQSELEAVVLKEDDLRSKVRDFELQMEGHRKRVEGAEKTILDLRQSLVSSNQQASQAESELEHIRKAYLQKESQSQELAKQVGRLQRLCADKDSNIKVLQQGRKKGASGFNEQSSDTVRMELVRLSTVEKTLREELDALKSEAISWQGLNNELVETLERVQSNTGVDHNLRTNELEEENKLLATSLKHAEEERDSSRELLKTLESKLAGVEEDIKALHDEVGRERNKVQEKEREIHRIDRRVDGLLKNNQMLQGILAMREKASLISDQEAKEKEKAVQEAHQLEAEMRNNLQASARQVAFMNDRAELLSEKLKEREVQLISVKNECGKKEEVIRGLEQSLSDLARSMDAQNRRITQLSGKNGELSRHLHARGREVENLHTKIVEDSHSRGSSNEETDQGTVQARDVKQDLEDQNLLCKLLRDKLAQSEDDLSKQSEEAEGLIRSRDWFQAELQRAQNSLGEASHQLATLERTVKQKEEVISLWKVEKQGYVQDISNLRDNLLEVERERDEMREEADEMGREALRLSAEVEVLRRRVAQLEEDLLVKEGQISILRGSFGVSE